MGAGDADASADEDPLVAAAADAADRAAAFAALLSGGSLGRSAMGIRGVMGGVGGFGGVGDVANAAADDENAAVADDAAGASFGGGGAGSYSGLGAMAGAFASEDDDEDEDEELKAVKKKMKLQLAALARRRAEITGNGTPSMSRVTVAKFTDELRRYKRLREDLKEWSNAFFAKSGRRPTVKDVERTGIDFLVKNFKEYVALRDKLMSQTPYLRGQMEDVAKDTLPTPRTAGNKGGSVGGLARIGGGGGGGGGGGVAGGRDNGKKTKKKKLDDVKLPPGIKWSAGAGAGAGYRGGARAGPGAGAGLRRVVKGTGRKYTIGSACSSSGGARRQSLGYGYGSSSLGPPSSSSFDGSPPPPPPSAQPRGGEAGSSGKRGVSRGSTREGGRGQR